MQNYPIFPRPLDQHPVVQIRVCTVYTGDEFALDPFPISKDKGCKSVSTIWLVDVEVGSFSSYIYVPTP